MNIAAMKRSRVMWLAAGAVGVVLIAMIALTGGLYFRQESNSQDGSLDDSQYAGLNYDSFPNALGVAFNYLKFEPGDGLQVGIEFAPANNLENQDGLGASAPVCLFGDINQNFTAGQNMADLNKNIGLKGDVNWFPFDVYTKDLFFAGFVGNGQSGDECVDELPIKPFIFGSIQGFTITAVAKPVPLDDGVHPAFVQLTITAKRTQVSRAFSVLIFIVMWLLTGSIVFATLWYWITGRRVDLPIIALGMSLLFALPNIRNAQPGIVTRAGIISDLVGYIWNLLLVSLCVVSLVINYIYRKDGKKPKPKPEPKPEKVV